MRDVSKHYGSVTAAEALSFDVEPGAILALLGASGCGKTTTLRLLAGLEQPDTGVIWLDGRKVAGEGTWIEPEHRSIGMVFQDYALFPHMSVRANVAFPLDKLSGKERTKRVNDLLALVGLSQQADRHPHQLSGGQQQRVALARALAPAPAVVLLDEPFSNLDAALRRTMREEVRDILKEAGATAVFVTHDQEEALSIADSVAVMRGGRLLQIGTPQEIYLRPVDRQMAAFLGDANFLPGDASGGSVTCALGELPLLDDASGNVEIMLRPEAMSLIPDADGSATVTDVCFYGHDQTVTVRLDSGVLLDVRTWARPDVVPGVRVRLDVRGSVLALPDSETVPSA
jgi:iron(III) transport system ATP-binding protein